MGERILVFWGPWETFSVAFLCCNKIKSMTKLVRYIRREETIRFLWINNKPYLDDLDHRFKANLLLHPAAWVTSLISPCSRAHWPEVEIAHWFHRKRSHYKLNGFRFLLFLHFTDSKDFNLKTESTNIACVTETENKIGLGGVRSGCKFL